MIVQHRALGRIQLRRSEPLLAALLALGGLAACVGILPHVAGLWRWMFRVAHAALELPGSVGIQTYDVGVTRFALPYIQAALPAPSRVLLLVGAIITMCLVLLSFVLRRWHLPLRYLIRAVALVQATALLFFAFSPRGLPYDIGDYAVLVLESGLVLIALVPVLFGFALYVFDLGLWRKVALTVLTAGHLVLIVPLLVMVHVYLAMQISGVVLPVLYLFAGIPLGVLLVIAFYGWGMSWPPGSRSRLAQVSVRGGDAAHRTVETEITYVPPPESVAPAFCPVCGEGLFHCRCARCANDLARRGAYAPALALLVHIAPRTPANIRRWKITGIVALAVGDVRTADLAWRIAALQDDQAAHSWAVSLRQGIISQARRMYNDALEAARSGAWESAERELQQTLARLPGFVPANVLTDLVTRATARDPAPTEDEMYSIREELGRLLPIVDVEQAPAPVAVDDLLARWQAVMLKTSASPRDPTGETADTRPQSGDIL